MHIKSVSFDDYLTIFSQLFSVLQSRLVPMSSHDFLELANFVGPICHPVMPKVLPAELTSGHRHSVNTLPDFRARGVQVLQVLRL